MGGGRGTLGGVGCVLRFGGVVGVGWVLWSPKNGEGEEEKKGGRNCFGENEGRVEGRIRGVCG